MLCGSLLRQPGHLLHFTGFQIYEFSPITPAVVNVFAIGGHLYATDGARFIDECFAPRFCIDADDDTSAVEVTPGCHE